MLLKIVGAWCLLVLSEVLGFESKFQEALNNNEATRYSVNYDEMIGTNWRYISRFPSAADSADQTQSSSDPSAEKTDEDAFDSWSIVWYIASFGGLIGFFLVVSCSEWCCRKRIRENQTRRTAVTPSTPTSVASETPPPAYDLFAPPSYDSLHTSSANEKNEFDIYVVPVHAISSLVDTSDTRQQQQEEPPSYTSISMTANRNTSGST